MTLGMLCARRAAILAALAGGLAIAVVGAGLCAEGVVVGGGALVDGARSALAWFGL